MGSIVQSLPYISTNGGNNRKLLTSSGYKTVCELTSVGKKRWMKVIRTVNTVKRFNKSPGKSKERCRCNEEIEEDESNESTVNYHEPRWKLKRARFMKERSLWDFVNSDQWVDKITITSGRLLENLLCIINILLREKKTCVYKTVQYQPLLANSANKPEEKEKLMHVLRVTKEYYFPAPFNLVSKGSEDKDHDREPSAISEGEQKSIAGVNQKIGCNIYNMENDISDVDNLLISNEDKLTYPKYFLPRINPTFQEECLQGVCNFQISKITTTDSATWTTERKLFIQRL